MAFERVPTNTPLRLRTMIKGNERTQAVDYFADALDAEESAQRRDHVRKTLQLLIAEDSSIPTTTPVQNDSRIPRTVHRSC